MTEKLLCQQEGSSLWFLLAEAALPASPWETCSFPAFERVLCSLNDAYYDPQAINWISNNSDWVQVQIAKIAFKERIHASWTCGIHTFLFFFFNLFFFWLFCSHLNQIYGREVLFSAETFSCFAFLCHLSPSASESLSDLCRTWITRALGLLTPPWSAGGLCCKLMYHICLHQDTSFN